MDRNSGVLSPSFLASFDEDSLAFMFSVEEFFPVSGATFFKVIRVSSLMLMIH